MCFRCIICAWKTFEKLLKSIIGITHTPATYQSIRELSIGRGEGAAYNFLADGNTLYCRTRPKFYQWGRCSHMLGLLYRFLWIQWCRVSRRFLKKTTSLRLQFPSLNTAPREVDLRMSGLIIPRFIFFKTLSLVLPRAVKKSTEFMPMSCRDLDQDSQSIITMYK